MAKTKRRKKIYNVPIITLLAVAIIVAVMYYLNIPPLDFDLNIGFKQVVRNNDDTNLGGETGSGTGETGEATMTDGELSVHFIDVGQGDSILIRFPDGKNMLVDGGDKKSDSYTAIAEVLTTYNVETLDYVLLTHTDADHCGSLDDVIASDVLAKKVYMPYIRSKSEIDPITTGKTDVPTALQNIIDENNARMCYIETVAYKDFVEAVVADKAEIEYSLQGEVIDGEGYKITFYTPTPAMYALVKNNGNSKDINNVSPIMILEYNSIKIMLTGDVASDATSKGHAMGAEGVFLDYVSSINADVDVDILKVAHHGSESSSCMEFLNVVKPEYAVISVGAGNSYGHPHAATLSRLENIGAEIYTTIDYGNITLVVDENGEFAFSFERAGQ